MNSSQVWCVGGAALLNAFTPLCQRGNGDDEQGCFVNTEEQNVEGSPGNLTKLSCGCHIHTHCVRAAFHQLQRHNALSGQPQFGVFPSTPSCKHTSVPLHVSKMQGVTPFVLGGLLCAPIPSSNDQRLCAMSTGCMLAHGSYWEDLDLGFICCCKYTRSS